jgi:hypothetical protein
VLVSQTYTIPNSPEWPENVRGMPLGQKLTYIKSRSNILTEYPERRDELLRMGTYHYTAYQEGVQLHKIQGGCRGTYYLSPRH